jgi:hypothetical protein
MPTTSNFGWTTPADTDYVKDGALAIRTLANGIDTSLVDLKGGTTGQILSKNSNTDLDYTWINNDQGDITNVAVTSPITGGGSSGSVTIGIQDGTTAQKGAVQLENSTSSTSTTTAAVPASVKSAYDLANAAIPKSLIDAEGDLIVGDAADAVQRLAVGTTGQVLTVDTSVDGKLKWATAGGGDFTFISKTSVSGVGTANFNNLFTSTYDNYLIVISNLTGTTNNELHWRMRTSTTNAQTSYYLAATGYGSGGAANNMSESNANEMRICPPPTGNNDYLTAYVWVSNPYLSTHTVINFTAFGDNGSVFVARNGAGIHRQTTSYDGISFGLYGGGNITCDVTCYGIKKS